MMIPDNVWLRNPGYARVGYGFLQGVMTIGRSVHAPHYQPMRQTEIHPEQETQILSIGLRLSQIVFRYAD